MSFIFHWLNKISSQDISVPNRLILDLPDLKKELDENTYAEVLLTEYKETVETLRNWDRLVFQMLTIIGTVIAGVLALSKDQMEPMFWGAVVSLLLFWVFTYIYLAKLAESRIDVLIEIEIELGMKGHYRTLRGVKQARTLVIWFVLPFLGAFFIGPLTVYLLLHFDRVVQFINSIQNYIINIR